MGSMTDITNYRLIDLTSIACKMVERFIRDSITSIIKRQQLIDTVWHEFLSGRPCLSKLLSAVNMVSKAMDEGSYTDLCYFDFNKIIHGRPCSQWYLARVHPRPTIMPRHDQWPSRWSAACSPMISRWEVKPRIKRSPSQICVWRWNGQLEMVWFITPHSVNSSTWAHIHP